MARRINLVPASERVRTTTNVGMLVAVACAIIVFFALGFVYYLWNSTLNDRQLELADVQQERLLTEAQAATLKQYESLASNRQETEEMVRQVYAGRTLVADILDSVSLVVPESVWFATLDITTTDPAASWDAPEGTRARSDGVMSVDGSTHTFEDVAQFLVRLKLIPALSEVTLGNASSVKQSEEVETVKTFAVEAAVHNTQDPATPLPVSQVEVEGI